MTLKEKRTERGLSQADLSALTGISKRTLQAYEQGERNINMTDLDRLTTLSITLGCSITDLLTDENLIKKCGETTL